MTDRTAQTLAEAISAIHLRLRHRSRKLEQMVQQGVRDRKARRQAVYRAATFVRDLTPGGVQRAQIARKARQQRAFERRRRYEGRE